MRWLLHYSVDICRSMSYITCMRKRQAKADAVLSVRISSDLKRQMEAASEAGPYRVSITNLVERGLELALKELADIRGKQSK
jgi:hypothetical protein